MTHFVLRYERLLGHADVEEIDDVAKAFARLFELEHETAHLDDVEGVLLSAENRSVIERTHARYLRSVVEFSGDFAKAVESGPRATRFATLRPAH